MAGDAGDEPKCCVSFSAVLHYCNSSDRFVDGRIKSCLSCFVDLRPHGIRGDVTVLDWSVRRNLAH